MLNVWIPVVLRERLVGREGLINVFLPQNPPEFADFRLRERDRGGGGGIERWGKWEERRREREHSGKGFLKREKKGNTLAKVSWKEKERGNTQGKVSSLSPEALQDKVWRKQIYISWPAPLVWLGSIFLTSTKLVPATFSQSEPSNFSWF